MKRITIILIGEEPKPNTPPLIFGKLDSEEEKTDKSDKVQIEEFETTNRTPELGDNITLPRDVVEALLAGAKKGNKKEDKDVSEDKFERMVAKLTEALENQNPTNHYLGARPVDMYSIDKDDVLPYPAVFFAHSISYMILDDRKNGVSISTPYKRIFKFKKVIRQVTQSPGNRTPVYLSISACYVYSKKEVEWLKSHSLFGIKFFETLGEGKDISAEMQEKLVTAWNMVSGLDEHTVSQRCIGLSIPIDTQDFRELRRRLAKKMAASMLKDATASARRAVKDLSNFQNGTVEVVGEGKTEKQENDLEVASPTY